MNTEQGRYSRFIRPMAYIIDLTIIALFASQFHFGLVDYLYFVVLVSLGWLALSLKSNFYEIYRFTKDTTLLSLTILQAVIFALLVFAFFGIFNELRQQPATILKYTVKVFAVILTIKLTIFYLLKKYRKLLGGNFRKTVIIGDNSKTQRLKEFFNQNEEYGYQCKKVFNAQKNEPLELSQCFQYILEQNVDEIYCSTSALENKQINQLINFADNNLKVLKFLPDNKDLYAKRLKMEYYDYLPIISLRVIPIQEPINQFLKRLFDIVLSLLVIVLLLSWLTPLLAILIKLSSPGPVFFRQKRNGLDNQEFFCYKFRSMRVNSNADIRQAQRNDTRITRIGKFLRKTSIDELPQFINVLLGDMSVVGPRPHMVSHTHIYAKTINKFMVRHFVKPGITGLAQTNGFRGQVESENDIINRVRYDIFYIENWSLLLDIKVIFQTVINALKGEDKAY